MVCLVYFYMPYIYIHIHHIHIYTYIHIHAYIHIYMHIYTCVHICIYVYLCIHTCVHLCVLFGRKMMKSYMKWNVNLFTFPQSPVSLHSIQSVLWRFFQWSFMNSTTYTSILLVHPFPFISPPFPSCLSSSLPPSFHLSYESHYDHILFCFLMFHLQICSESVHIKVIIPACGCTVLHRSAPPQCSTTVLHHSAPLHCSTPLLHCTAPPHCSTALPHCSAPLHCSTAMPHCSAPLQCKWS
jgi:hypothetical protein